MATIDPNTPAVQARIQSTAEARARNEATVPSLLSLEKATNPYLRADHPDLKAAVGMEGASDLEVFTEIRRRKDNF
jgi:hydroxyacylglutathione hydrolase